MRKYFTSNKVFLGLLLIFAVVFCAPSFSQAKDIGKGCETFEKKIDKYVDGGCWSCDIFILFFDGANRLAGQINKVVEKPAIAAMAVFLGLWLVFQTAIFFSSVAEAPDTNEFLGKVGGMMIKSVFVIVFLTGGATFAFDYFINPVLITTSSLGVSILQDSNGGISCEITDSAATADKPMSSGVRDSLECFILAIANGMAKSQAIASALRCSSLYWLTFDVWIPFVDDVDIAIWGPHMWLCGVTMGCLFTIIAFLFPLTILDVIFRIGLIIGMLPLFLVAWLFPMTASFAKKGWDLFFQSTLVLTISALVVAMVVAMIEASWNLSVEATSTRAADFKEGLSKLTSGASSIEAYTESVIDGFDKIFATALTDMFVVLFVSLWGLVIAKKTDQLANEFAGDEFPESCGLQALNLIIETIFNIFFLILTIVSVGITAFTWVGTAAQKVDKFVKLLEKLRKIAEKAKKLQEDITKN